MCTARKCGENQFASMRFVTVCIFFKHLYLRFPNSRCCCNELQDFQKSITQILLNLLQISVIKIIDSLLLLLYNASLEIVINRGDSSDFLCKTLVLATFSFFPVYWVSMNSPRVSRPETLVKVSPAFQRRLLLRSRSHSLLVGVWPIAISVAPLSVTSEAFIVYFIFHALFPAISASLGQRHLERERERSGA